jgi:hypothetical protein
MRLSDPWGITVGTLGIIVANLLLISVRAFASRTGLQVRWLSRSYAPERGHLRKLASSTDKGTALRARRYLRLEILAWTVFVVSAVLFFWGVMNR